MAIEVSEGNTADPENPGRPDQHAQDPVRVNPGSAWSAIGACSPVRASKKNCGPLSWMGSARCAPQIKAFVAAGALQLSLFDEQYLAQITHPDYPGERLVCCRGPARPTSAPANAASCWRRPKPSWTIRRGHPAAARQGQDRSAGEQGDDQLLKDRQALQHRITDDSFTFRRNHDQIAAEAALDGIYMLRTNLPSTSGPTAMWCCATKESPMSSVFPHHQRRVRRAPHPPQPGRPGACPPVSTDALLVHQRLSSSKARRCGGVGVVLVVNAGMSWRAVVVGATVARSASRLVKLCTG